MSNNASRIAVFPGSFDPVTKGHEAIVKRALPLFDKIIIAIGNNTEKNKYFTLDQRKLYLQKTFAGWPKTEVAVFEGLTVNFCESVGANFILRGLRSVSDFEFEKNIAQINRSLKHEIETVFLLTDPEYIAFTSTIVRDIHKYGGNVKLLVPDAIADYF
ncbi:MAG: pantetheine-phosphate adenylyltransferase [Bacteroidota bacterium]|jgi:pantetheine-phosphate adenylyltransferase